MAAALLVLAAVGAVPAPAAVADDQIDLQPSGALGAVHPDLIVDGRITGPADGLADGRSAPVHGTAAEVAALLEGREFVWDDQPYPMGEPSAAAVGARSWHRKGRAGAGVTVAVVDLGFDGYRDLLGSSLPASVESVSFRRDGTIGGGTGHGTAAAEIVHSVAPAADLHLVAYDGDLFRVVQYLIDHDVDLVSFSVGYLSGPFDGSSPASRAVRWALDEGIVWVSAAGNFAEHHWGGVLRDDDADGWIEFSGADELDEITVAAGAEFHLYLSWVGGGDLDLCIYRIPARLTDPLGCAAATQTDGDRGLEVAKWKNQTGQPARFGFAVRHRSGSPARLDAFAWNVTDVEHTTKRGSVIAPGDVSGAVTVGAVGWTAPDRVLAYSGRGPTAGGVAKPDLVAPTGLPTDSWGAYGGTSGATPHVAGVAALLLEAYPATPADEMAALLADRAGPIQMAGAGAGVVSVGRRTPACRGRAPTLVGTGGDDWIVGTDGADVIHAGRGADTVLGAGGGDLICAGPGDDIVYGNNGDDRLFGNAGDDRILGGGGADRLNGGAGDDSLFGGKGGDRCRSGSAAGCEAG